MHAAVLRYTDQQQLCKTFVFYSEGVWISCFVITIRSVKKLCDAFISYQSVPGEINTEQGDIPHVTSMMTSLNGNLFRLTGPLCGNSPVTGEFPSQRLVTRSFDVFFDLRLNKRFSKQSRRRWFEASSGTLWRHCNGYRNKELTCLSIPGGQWSN